MIRVAIIGQGLVATHFAVGLERLKQNEIPDYGIPLRNRLKYDYSDIEIVVSYDVDKSKVGKTVYDAAIKVFNENSVPATLKDIEIREGIHLGSLKGLPFEATGIEERVGLENAIEEIISDWKSMDVDVVLNLITTEPAVEFNELSKLQEALETSRLSASQAYAYALAKYSRRVKPSAFINNIPVPIANDDAFVKLYVESNAVVFGDDASTGATPLTADLLEHMRERNRSVLDIAQFNIGGNTDFLSLDQPERNVMKKATKSSIVKDILGYEAPNYIKPTGYLEPLGDKKFVAMILEYLSFNGFKDEIYIVARINDSPALAGLLVDLTRLGKIAVEKEVYGTCYPINAFYMKRPGPRGSKAIAKFKAYQALIEWLGLNEE